MTLHAPLVVFETTAVCDGPAPHEVRVITDGPAFYAYGLAHGASDCPRAHREGSILVIACGQPLLGDAGACLGQIRVDVSTPDTWTADPGALALLAQYGEVVDR